MRLLVYGFQRDRLWRVVAVSGSDCAGGCYSVCWGNDSPPNVYGHVDAATCDQYFLEYFTSGALTGWMLVGEPIVVEAEDPPNYVYGADGHEFVKWARRALEPAVKTLIPLTVRRPPLDFVPVRHVGLAEENIFLEECKKKLQEGLLNASDDFIVNLLKGLP